MAGSTPLRPCVRRKWAGASSAGLTGTCGALWRPALPGWRGDRLGFPRRRADIQRHPRRLLLLRELLADLPRGVLQLVLPVLPLPDAHTLRANTVRDGQPIHAHGPVVRTTKPAGGHQAARVPGLRPSQTGQWRLLPSAPDTPSRHLKPQVPPFCWSFEMALPLRPEPSPGWGVSRGRGSSLWPGALGLQPPWRLSPFSRVRAGVRRGPGGRCAPPRLQENETWWLCNCTKAICKHDRTVELVQVECKPPPMPTCSNSLTPVRVLDPDGCCWHWECDCKPARRGALPAPSRGPGHRARRGHEGLGC